jgi:hypothetical protein
VDVAEEMHQHALSADFDAGVGGGPILTTLEDYYALSQTKQ